MLVLNYLVLGCALSALLAPLVMVMVVAAVQCGRGEVKERRGEERRRRRHCHCCSRHWKCEKVKTEKISEKQSHADRIGRERRKQSTN